MRGRFVSLISLALINNVLAAHSTLAAGAFAEVNGGSSQAPNRWASEGHEVDSDPSVRPRYARADSSGEGVGGSWVATAEGGDDGHGRISLRAAASATA